jgi:hypothetical protein
MEGFIVDQNCSCARIEAVAGYPCMTELHRQALRGAFSSHPVTFPLPLMCLFITELTAAPAAISHALVS